MRIKIFPISIMILLSSVLVLGQADSLSVEYGSFKRKIKIPVPSEKLKKEFNALTKSKEAVVTKENGKIIKGYSTGNREFLKKVIAPILKPRLKELSKMKKTELINTLTLFEHELFSVYFGRDFYRWGGDILDLDDPQDEEIRHEYKYGLDCSGFSTSPYELAVYFGLIKPDDEAALFSSKGFELYCVKNNVQDKGGREGTSNHFRLDTRELAGLGREVFSVKKGGSPTEEQIALLQPGDLAGKNGHFGIIAFINNKPYYLESGGYVLPKKGGLPYPALPALAMCTVDGDLTIRRCLPDDNAVKTVKNSPKETGIKVFIPDTAVTEGGIYNIPLKVVNFKNIGAISLKVQFDSTLLAYKGLMGAPKDFLAGAGKPGFVNIGWFDMTARTPMNFGDGDLFYMQFEYKAKGDAKIGFVLKDCEIADGAAAPLPVKFQEGVLKIK
jgi:hypothetical protein